MPDDSETQAPGFGTVEFALQVQNAAIEVRAQLPEGPVRPDVLLPVLQGLSNSMTDLAVLAASQLGEHVSCHEGCGACCRQAVPIAPAEARAIAVWLDQQPAERQTVLRERFREAAVRLEDSGIAQAIRLAGPAPDREAMQELGLRYFALGIPCPFLEDERCAIHEIRPLRCREYLVVSPAEHCAHPQTKQIVGIRPPVLLSPILAQWDESGDRRPRTLILLTMLQEWLENHPVKEDRPNRTSPELLQEFLHAFTRDAEAAPLDPRGAPDQL